MVTTTPLSDAIAPTELLVEAMAVETGETRPEETFAA